MTEEKTKGAIAEMNKALQQAQNVNEEIIITMGLLRDIKENFEALLATRAELESLKAHEEKEHQFCKNICEPQYKAEIKRLQQNSTGLRPCYVRDAKALFHKWVQRRELLSSSIARGGHNGGEVELTLAIVEFENGQAYEVHPKDLRFADSAGLFKQFAFDEEREAKT